MMLLQGQQVKQQDVSAWMTGIQEVELPLDFKLKNIEETEAAKKSLLSSAGAGPGRWARPGISMQTCPFMGMRPEARSCCRPEMPACALPNKAPVLDTHSWAGSCCEGVISAIFRLPSLLC